MAGHVMLEIRLRRAWILLPLIKFIGPLVAVTFGMERAKDFLSWVLSWERLEQRTPGGKWRRMRVGEGLGNAMRLTLADDGEE